MANVRRDARACAAEREQRILTQAGLPIVRRGVPPAAPPAPGAARRASSGNVAASERAAEAISSNACLMCC
jgi:hypothetical protein